jgi:8-oxo-dGTP pyrophosphatase MutT (NUDIX family)
MTRYARVVVYVERGDELLVFDHRDYPAAGTQVPAGGVEEGEEPAAAAIREVLEETGLAVTDTPAFLGTHDHDDALGRPAHTLFFRVDAPLGAPDEWEHRVSGGDDAGLVFLCRFERGPELWPVQAVFQSAVQIGRGGLLGGGG